MNEPVPRQQDPYAHYDATYVLGALSPADRADFERHMATCDGCARAVRELAGVPGLLARAEPVPSSPEGPPAGLLPALAGKARRGRRRRRVTTIGAAALAVLASLALVLALVIPGGDGFDGTPMAVLGDYPVHGSMSLTATNEGTRVEMSCGYEGSRAWDYVLVLIPRDGPADRIATWHALPGQPVRISAASPIDRADVGAVEVRTPAGTPVLRYDTDG